MKKEEDKTQGQPKAKKPTDKEKRAAEEFKRKYFEFYDDVKISVKEDW